MVGWYGREETVVAIGAILSLQKELNKTRRKFKYYQPEIHGLVMFK